MNTFAISTLGCKVNQYESQQIRELLERLGLRRFGPPEKPDIAVINTCCITHTASAKSRQQIHKLLKLYPKADIVICGCLPTVRSSESFYPSGNIHLIKNRGDLATFLTQITNNNNGAPDDPGCPNIFIKSEKSSQIKHKKDLLKLPRLLPLTSYKNQTRAFLKIQDGCDGYCTYCIVPKTRPFVHSRPADVILQEAQALVKAGHKEIVITGISIGSYGQKSVRRKNWPVQQNNKLADLLDKLADISNLARIRLSSLQPADITSRLIDVLHRHRNIMPHIHLSVQSGSDAILKRMCRQYNADQIREKVELIKTYLDKPAITTDIIVGFPGETDADFDKTVNIAKDIGFAKMHIFRFSPREGTAAADMQNTVDNRVIKYRSQVLRDLDIEMGRKFRQQFIGQNAEILIENDSAQPQGRCERYFMVNLVKMRKKTRINDLIKVKILKNSKIGVFGQVVSQDR